MSVLLFILSLLSVFWILFGRGALLVCLHKKDEGVLLAEGQTDKDAVMAALKSEMTYRNMKDLYFDEKGDICIEGKYGMYAVCVDGARVYVDEKGGARKTKAGKNGFVFFLSCLPDRQYARYVEELECIAAYVAKVFDHNAPVDANEKYRDMTKAHKKANAWSIALGVLAVIFLIAAISSATDPSLGIRDSYFSAYSDDVTVGDAFEDYFSDTEWENYESGNSQFVRFTGGCTWYGDPAEMQIHFGVEGDWFYVDEIILFADGERYAWSDERRIDEIFYDIYFGE